MREATERAVDAVFVALKNVLLAGDRYSHQNFGTFYTTDLEARNARNIRSGEQIEVPARRAARFKACVALKNEVRDSAPQE